MAYKFEQHMSHMDRRVTTGMRDGQQTAIVIAGRTYATDALDLWNALTSAERLSSWFLPVTGDLRLGGRYQFQGNAGGTIEACDKPELIRATWEFGGGEFGITQSAVSQQLQVVRQQGFATVRSEGRRRIYAIDKGPFQTITDWVSHYSAFWAVALNDLGAELEKGKAARTASGKPTN